MADTRLFVLEKVCFHYGEKPAIADLDLIFSAGLFYGVVGPNGSGKTTLLDLLLGVKKADSGQIAYRDKPVNRYNKMTLAKEMALVPQEFQIHFGFTVQEAVLMGRHPYIPRFSAPGAPDFDIAGRAMETLDITHLSDCLVTGLSGGEKQRVVAARALAQQTRVLMLDEATSNLDIQHTLSILQVARRLVREEGKTVIAVLHNLNLAGAYCDRLVFLKKGRLHSSGTVEQTLTPENIREVFGVECQVVENSFSGVPQVSYRYGI